MKTTFPVASFLCALCIGSAVAGEPSAHPEEAPSAWRPLPIWGGGYMMDVKVAPSASNVWYALVDVGGPYRSDDAGATWRPLHRQSRLLDCGPYASMARGISIDPRDADSFVTAVGDVPELGGGLLVSLDGGETFRKTGSACFRSNGPRRMHGIVIDRNPFNPDELIAGECLDGFHISTDNGENWTDCGPKGFWFSDLRFDLVRSGVVYACAPEHQGRGGFFRSLNGGREWMRLSDESPTEVRQIPGQGELLGLFHDRVRLSADCGETWCDYSDGLILENLMTDGDPNPSKSTGVYVAAGAGSSFWLVGNRHGDIFIRRPGDAAWTKTARQSQCPGDPPAEHSIAWSCKCRKMDALCSIVVVPGDDSHWLACDWHVIWESLDAGRNWTTRVKGITPLCPFAVSGSPAKENVVLYGVADMGMYVSTDGGRSFHPERATSGANSFAFSALHPETGYAVGGKFTIDLLSTSDGGETWCKLDGLAGLPPLKPKERGAYSVAVDPLTDDVWLAVSGPCRPGDGGTWRSRDGGASWQWLGTGLPEGEDLFKSYEFDKGNADSQLVFSPDGALLACSHKTGRMARFNRETQTWEPAGRLAEGSRVFADPHLPGRFLRVGGKGEESLDGGRTFHPYPSIPARCWYLAFDPRCPGSVVAGGPDGLFASRDGGTTFEPLAGGLDVPANGSRVMVLDRGRLWLLTFGAGVWTREL